MDIVDRRVNHYYAPWACGHERHVYEKCQYKEFKRRVAIMTEEKRRRSEAVLGAAA
jgi:NADH dehydrogenase (ubiquinone) 1 beta subcomplex subunit 7